VCGIVSETFNSKTNKETYFKNKRKKCFAVPCSHRAAKHYYYWGELAKYRDRKDEAFTLCE